MARNDHPGAKTVADSRSATEKQNAEYYARLDAAKPTPTQEENDLARVGALDIDDKEDDGSESEDVAQRRQMESRLAPAAAPYANRAMASGQAGDKPAAAPTALPTGSKPSAKG